MSCITHHMHSVLPEKIEDRRYNEEEENKDTKETKPYKNQLGTMFRRLERHCNNVCTRTQ